MDERKTDFLEGHWSSVDSISISFKTAASFLTPNSPDPLSFPHLTGHPTYFFFPSPGCWFSLSLPHLFPKLYSPLMGLLPQFLHLAHLPIVAPCCQKGQLKTQSSLSKDLL